jgi:hypothetical protein
MMRPCKQQRIGKSYLHGVLHNAQRPFTYRAGVSRLLNNYAESGASIVNRKFYLPFNLTYQFNAGAEPAYPYSGQNSFASSQAIDNDVVAQGNDLYEASKKTKPPLHSQLRRSLPVAELEDASSILSEPVSSLSTSNAKEQNGDQPIKPAVTSMLIPDEAKDVDRLVRILPEDKSDSASKGNSLIAPAKEAKLTDQVEVNNSSADINKPGAKQEKNTFSSFVKQLGKQLEARNFGVPDAEPTTNPYLTPNPESFSGTVVAVKKSGEGVIKQLIPVTPSHRQSLPPTTDSTPSVLSKIMGINSVQLQPKPMPDLVDMNLADDATRVFIVKAQASELATDRQKLLPREYSQLMHTTVSAVDHEDTKGHKSRNKKREENSNKKKKPSQTIIRTVKQQQPIAAFWERSYLAHTQLRFYK